MEVRQTSGKRKQDKTGYICGLSRCDPMKKYLRLLSEKQKKLIRKFGIAGFLFFLLKGLAWIFLTWLIVK